MYKILLILQLLIFPMVLFADELPKLSCPDQNAIHESMITALSTQNQTLTLRVQALSQLLAVAQRQESDGIALDAVSLIENKILKKMGLSIEDCKIQMDGSVMCAIELEKEQKEKEKNSE